MNFIHNAKIRVKVGRSSLKQDKIYFSYKNVSSLFIVYELNTQSKDLNTDFTPDNCLFRTVKLAKNNDKVKCGYRGYGVGFGAQPLFKLQNSEFRRKFAVFAEENSSLVQADIRKNNILVLVEGPIDG